jgi:predicted nucleic acid-binding protein
VIVADTNLIAYLLVPGPQSAAAVQVFHRDPEWWAPWLWRSEFLNVLSTYVRHGLMDAAAAQATMRDARTLLAGREAEVADDAVLSEAAASRHPSYDCEFVVLARALGAPLVTADAKLLRRFPDVAMSPEDFASGS